MTPAGVSVRRDRDVTETYTESLHSLQEQGRQLWFNASLHTAEVTWCPLARWHIVLHTSITKQKAAEAAGMIMHGRQTLETLFSGFSSSFKWLKFHHQRKKTELKLLRREGKTRKVIGQTLCLSHSGAPIRFVAFSLTRSPQHEASYWFCDISRPSPSQGELQCVAVFN